MNFNIEKGISLTKKAVQEGSKYDVLPLSQMIVGDSIFVPEEFSNTQSIAAYMSRYKKENNVNFTIRKEGKGNRLFKIENDAKSV